MNQSRLDETVHLGAAPNKTTLKSSSLDRFVSGSEGRNDYVPPVKSPNYALSVEVAPRVRDRLGIGVRLLERFKILGGFLKTRWAKRELFLLQRLLLRRQARCRIRLRSWTDGREKRAFRRGHGSEARSKHDRLQ
jgi:hypothetical protein